MSIGSNIKRRRKELEMTLEEVSDLIKVSRQTMSRYETGIIGNIPSDKIEAIANALKTSPAYIMGWVEEKPATVAGDELNPLDKQLMEFLATLTIDQKEFLLAQLKTMNTHKKETSSFPDH